MPPEDTQNPHLPATVSSDPAVLIRELTARVYKLEQAVASLVAHQPSKNLDAKAESALGITVQRVAAPPPQPVAQLFAQSSVGTEEATNPKSSLEDRLGSQIFNRIAIVALLTGAALGLKLAIDNHVIGPIGRVLIGLISGAGLVVWSERFRRKEFAAFSYSLKALGSGVLYLSLWAAFQLYHLVPAPAAFGMMVLVTLWNAWMAWAQGSELLAGYAIAGAFATPLLLSTGGNHEVFLFGYLLTIDLATIVLVRLEAARAKNWSRLLIACLAATVVYFIGWFIAFYSADQLPSTSLFICAFLLAFITVPCEALKFGAIDGNRGNSPPRDVDPITDLLLPLANAIFGSVALYFALEDAGEHAALPWVALAFAALYLVLMQVRQRMTPKAVHLSLAVLFLTITIPLKASGRWVTIGWLAEGVTLLSISARLEGNELSNAVAPASIHRMLRRLAAFALTLGFCGLLVLPFWRDRVVRTAVLNQRFATELAGVIALGIAAWIAYRAAKVPNQSEREAVFPDWLQIAAVCTVALNLIALLAGLNEIVTFWQSAYTRNAESSLQTALSISSFFMLYGAVLLALGFWKQSQFLRWQALILLVIAIIKTFLYDVRSLNEGYRVVSFLGLGVVLLGISFFYVRKSRQLDSSKNELP